VSLPAGYCTPSEREARARSLAGAVGGEVRRLGSSVEGRPLDAIRVPAQGPSQDRVLVCANIHGVELIAVEAALGVLEALARGAGPAGELRARAEVWVVPSLNPDGAALTWEQAGHGTLKELRTNARGVDLNRNFPLPHPQAPPRLGLGGWGTGAVDPASPFYKGSSPFSEPETQALRGLLDEVPFRAGVNLHSSMGTLIPPCVTSREDYRAYTGLAAAFRRGQRRRRYRRLASYRLDRFIGEQEDYQHHVHGTWAVCVEHYPLWVDCTRFLRRSLFRRFNPPDPRPWVESDVGGVLSLLLAALDLPRPTASRALSLPASC
jgi:Zinc carboxypeptidase